MSSKNGTFHPKIAVIGLGYVGLPLAIEFAKAGLSVVGFDINEERIELIEAGIDPSRERHDFLEPEMLISFTSDPEKLKNSNFFIVAVPTPVDKYNVPNLKPLVSASNIIGKVLKSGDYVVYESTTYPGCTEDDCLPILIEQSGLKLNEEFKLGYSPERINPGDKVHSLTKVVKVVSGSDEESLFNIKNTYERIVKAGVHCATSIKVAEASKIVENTQRDLNISLMNELSLIFDRMDINTFDVLEASGTKWNFLKFEPGLVGGHCIGVDPYYLTHKASSLGYTSKVISSSRNINDDMARNIAKKLIKQLFKISSNPRILVKGVTFKPDVSDIRNSKIIDTIKELLEFDIRVSIEDPHANPKEVKQEYGLDLVSPQWINESYDAILLAIPHREYMNLPDEYFFDMINPGGIIYDLKGIFRKRTELRKNFLYWSL